MCRSGCSSVWLEYLVWDQGAEGSSPFTPTTFIFKIKIMVRLAQLVRALVCGTGGREFEPRISPHKLKYKNFKKIINFVAFVAQLDRVSDFGSDGYRFESYRAHHFYKCMRP